jgi:hypothetical protein
MTEDIEGHPQHSGFKAPKHLDSVKFSVSLNRPYIPHNTWIEWVANRPLMGKT